jgi:hypothetical protein
MTTVVPVAFMAHNNKFVCAHVGSDLALQATADSIGDWEKFELCYLDEEPIKTPPAQLQHYVGWKVTLKSLANSKFVTAQFNMPDNILRAGADLPRDWRNLYSGRYQASQRVFDDSGQQFVCSGTSHTHPALADTSVGLRAPRVGKVYAVCGCALQVAKKAKQS